jgi:hypothetical protein
MPPARRNGATYHLCTPQAPLNTALHTPLVVEMQAYHLDGGFVLFADSKIELFSEDGLARLAK